MRVRMGMRRRGIFLRTVPAPFVRVCVCAFAFVVWDECSVRLGGTDGHAPFSEGLEQRD